MTQAFSTAVAVRPQRRWQMDHHDAQAGGYAHRLPPAERAWLERFDREVYAVDAQRVRTGLHADRLRPEARKALEALPRRVLVEIAALRAKDPAAALAMELRLLGMGKEAVDTSLRRRLYVEQNAAARDVYSLGRVVHFEERETT
jgi:hypothetical protein